MQTASGSRKRVLEMGGQRLADPGRLSYEVGRPVSEEVSFVGIGDSFVRLASLVNQADEILTWGRRPSL